VSVAGAIAVMSVLAAVTGTVVAYLGYRAGTRADRKKDLAEDRKQAIGEALGPVSTALAVLSDQVQRMSGAQHELAGRMSGQEREMAETRAKVEMFWSVLGREAARNLHAPHPERQHIDRLLERFTAVLDGKGTMSDGERAELRAHLRYIAGLPAGAEPGYPVFDGDRVWASVLLAVLDVTEGSGNARSGKKR
jgi:hypothetical protein